MIIPPTLIIGFGNPDRQDDGVAWYILSRLTEKMGRTIPPMDEGFNLTGENPDLLFVLQLFPELSEIMARYDRVCFIDAHTGNIPEDIYSVNVPAKYQQSPFTHHMTAGTCLSLAQSLYGRSPTTIIFSIRGYEFGFSHELSLSTRQLAEQSLTQIMTWLNP